MPETISNIALIGDYCDWDADKAAQLAFIDNVWRTRAPDSMQMGQKYKFFVWEKGISGFSEFLIDPSKRPIYRYSPDGKHMQASINWGTFDHIYQGEKEFILDPALFQRPRKEARITTRGWELAEQFNKMPEEVYMLELEMVRPMNEQAGRVVKFDVKKHYHFIRAKFDSMEATYDPYFKDIFVEKKLRLHQLFSPIRRDMYQLISKPDTPKEQLAAFFESDSFRQNFEDVLALVKQLDPNSFFFTGDFVYNVLLEIPLYLEKWPSLGEEYDISVADCQEILDDFVQHSVNPFTRETVMYRLQMRFANMDSTALAEKYRKMLYKEFPDGFYVQAIKEEKNRFNWERVQPYPALDFDVTTLDGARLSLNEFRGRFVFIDFWGSWCGPCRQEIPNIIKMATELPSNKFQVIGLAKDEEKAMRKYLAKQELPYPNALVNNELLKA